MLRIIGLPDTSLGVAAGIRTRYAKCQSSCRPGVRPRCVDDGA